ncbi:MAG: hypothetical protein AAGB22_11895, partial [Bacteroidota bacterium]
MNHALLAGCCLFFTTGMMAQNLVPNPSFETASGCPVGLGQVPTLASWDLPPNHTGSSDYFNACAISALADVPTNFVGTQAAADGNAYAGIITYATGFPNYREYLQVQLTAPLVAGDIYNVTFQYSLAEASNYASDDFGVHFSASPLNGGNNFLVINAVPQVTSSDTASDTLAWNQFNESFVATGGEQIMTVGNFL